MPCKLKLFFFQQLKQEKGWGIGTRKNNSRLFTRSEDLFEIWIPICPRDWQTRTTSIDVTDTVTAYDRIPIGSWEHRDNVNYWGSPASRFSTRAADGIVIDFFSSDFCFFSFYSSLLSFPLTTRNGRALSSVCTFAASLRLCHNHCRCGQLKSGKENKSVRSSTTRAKSSAMLVASLLTAARSGLEVLLPLLVAFIIYRWENELRHQCLADLGICHWRARHCHL